MSTPIYSTLRIRFIENPGHPDTDEGIAIEPIYNSNATIYSQEYKINSKLGKYCYNSTVTGGIYLVEYIRSILNLVVNDSVPCKEIQFDVPNVPSILIKHASLYDCISTLLSTLQLVIQSWPYRASALHPNATAVPYSVPSPLEIPQPPRDWLHWTASPTARTRRHLHFDDDGNEVIDLTMDSDSSDSE